MNRLYSRGRAAYGSVRNLGKASGLSKKKAEQILRESGMKPAYYNYTETIARTFA